MTAITVVSVGPFAAVQDLGRPGLAHVGVSPSGAADRAAHARANRAVGNDASAATVEVLLGGFAATIDEGRWCAVTGATVGVVVAGRPVERALFHWPAGAVLELTPAVTGLRAYLAVAGGVIGTTVLGSASWDTLAGHGTPPAALGDVWTVGDPIRDPGWNSVDIGVVTGDTVDVSCTWGPRDDAFSRKDRTRLRDQTWTVAAASDRVGVRLDGLALEATAGSLPSEGCVRGSIQVPPSGQPIVFLADHPTTGGYPVIGVVDDEGVDVLAQLRPGSHIQLHPR